MLYKPLNQLFEKYGLLSVMRGTNAEVFKAIFEHYNPTSRKILDCTCGTKRFWKNINENEWSIIFSDIKRLGEIQADYNRLPFRNGVFDAIIFDPPFVSRIGFMRYLRVHGGKSAVYEKDVYSLSKRKKDFQFETLRVVDREFSRVLKRRGLLIFKIQDNLNGFAIQQTTKFLDAFKLVDIIIYVFPDVPIGAKIKAKIGKPFRKSVRIHNYFLIFERSVSL